MHGTRHQGIVCITRVNIAALLAHDAPFDFAAGASHNFLLNQRAQALHGPTNSHHAVLDTQYSIDPALLLSDQEWGAVSSLFEREADRNKKYTIPRRAVADALIKRMVTHAPWASPFYAPLCMNYGNAQWRNLRRDGRLRQFVDVMKRLRPQAAYLSANG
jgi:hypothetical protein